MSLIFSLPAILEESRREYEQIKESSAEGRAFFPVEKIHHRISSSESLLARGDNLDFIQYLLRERGLEGKLQLVYMDPPFYSKASYDAVIKLKSPVIEDAPAIKPLAYDDLWKTGMEEYLRMLCVRFFLIRDLLSEEGCFWVHLDWHVVHYVKILLDEIFGEKNFVNEIIWNYKSGGTGKRNFSRKHDTLLFYGKSKRYYFQPLQEKSYNRGYKPYRFKGVKEYRDELGWYTMVNMKDVWQIDMVGRTSAERTGYATQKPEQLLSRVIESCSRKGDLCADFFCGSGTLAAAAEKLGRPWICCDVGAIAAAGCLKRMSVKKSAFTLLKEQADRQRDGLELRLRAEPIEFTGKKLVTVTLTGYRLEEEDIPVQGKDLEVIKKFCEKDPLQLIEYWSVDFSYDGKVHNPEFSFPKEKDRIETVCRQILGNVGRVSVRAVDVFGSSTLKIFDPGEFE
ncbi:site-specific DNA-methyltransferase [bacterium 210820-DFI.6.37]|nr:site-specific DNA-methyltransferase [bacterium 210820-DFI.6.37]